MNFQPKIMILEDDRFFGKMIKKFLINQEFKNIQLFHEEDECIQAITKEPTILIIDHHLPNSIGLEVIQIVRKINPEIHFIYLSGQKTSKVAIKAFREGAIDYIEKNKDTFAHLKKTIDTFLKESYAI